MSKDLGTDVGGEIAIPVKPKKRKPGPKARKKAKAAKAAALAAAGLPIPPALLPPPLPPAAKPAPPPQTIAELGPPPADPLAANAWAHRMTLLTMHDAAIDPDLSPRERRKEIRTLAASAAKLIPQSRLFEAESIARGMKADVEAKASEKRGAALVPRPPKGKPDGAPA